MKGLAGPPAGLKRAPTSAKFEKFTCLRAIICGREVRVWGSAPSTAVNVCMRASGRLLGKLLRPGLTAPLTALTIAPPRWRAAVFSLGDPPTRLSLSLGRLAQRAGARAVWR